MVFKLLFKIYTKKLGYLNNKPSENSNRFNKPACKFNKYFYISGTYIITMKIDIRRDLSFRNMIYVFNDKSIKSTQLYDFRNPIVEEIPIIESPIIVENKNIHISNDNLRIVFDQQLDWMQVLAQKSNDSTYDTDIRKIDFLSFKN